jgi:hypothetical protein
MSGFPRTAWHCASYSISERPYCDHRDSTANWYPSLFLAEEKIAELYDAVCAKPSRKLTPAKLLKLTGYLEVRLLLQSLRQIVGALPQLVQQAGVLDGDDGLVGKGLEKRDLLISKRIDDGTSKDDRLDRFRLAQ